MKTLQFILTIAVITVSSLSCGGYAGRVESRPGRITGTVLGANDNQPLGNAAVQVVGTKTGAMTDTDGHFLIKRVPPGLYSLRVSQIGYVPLVLNNITVHSGKETIVDARLELQETKNHHDPVVLPEGS